MSAVSSSAGSSGRPGATRNPSIAVVGAGFGGVGAAVMLQRAGYGDVTVFEREARLGGVWHQNTYPGAACDVPSHLYEFSFAPNPRWSRRYAPQAEIQAYIEEVARRYGVLRRVRAGTEVTRARWDDERSAWALETSAGPHIADISICACGQLSVARVPPIPGLASFAGPAFHTARWRHDVDVSGKRVAVIGTGCSAVQVVPAIQPIAEQVDVYQRSPGWTFPRMDFAYGPRAQRLFERFRLLQRLDRAAVFAFFDLGAAALTHRRWLRLPFRAVARRQITKAIADRELRAKLLPRDELGCKRIMVTDDWYPTLARPNVELLTGGIAEVTPTGIRTDHGGERPADVIVLATGSYSHRFVAPMEIIGRSDRTLAQEWAGLPRAYLGVTVPGFPNMFLLYGPNTGGGTCSVIYMIEAALEHVIAALRTLEHEHAPTIEVTREAAEEFDRGLRAASAGTVWESGCTSWYLDDKGNNVSLWPWLCSTYRRRTARLDPDAYQLSPSRRLRRTTRRRSMRDRTSRFA
jgi:cation diffusion facilitator CzcD-associated flavoprotein CzcO